MKLTPRIDNAIKLASQLHSKQTRRDKSKTPYISHLVSVAIRLSEVTNEEDVIIAGLMHDSLEDVPNYTYSDLARDCGENVANIVKQVTEPIDANKNDNEQLPWLSRKESYIKNLKEGGKESAMVAASDKIHNIESFMNDFNTEGEAFLSRFHSSLKNKIWFHEQVLAIVVEKLGQDHKLTQQLTVCTNSFQKLDNEFAEFAKK